MWPFSYIFPYIFPNFSQKYKKYPRNGYKVLKKMAYFLEKLQYCLLRDRYIRSRLLSHFIARAPIGIRTQ